MPQKEKLYGRLRFLASAPVDARPAVEALFFFNPHQHASIDGIHRAVEETGIPIIVERDGRVWIEVPSGRMQCLFACDEADESRLLGVMLYGRPDPDTLWVSHMAVDPDHVLASTGTEPSVGVALVNKALEIARHIKGVRHVRLPYRQNSLLKLDPSRAP